MPVRHGLWAALLVAICCNAAPAQVPESSEAPPETRTNSETPADLESGAVTVEANKPIVSDAPASEESSDSADSTETAEAKEPAGPHDWLIKHPTIQRLLELHNQTRARVGLPPLTLNPNMCLSAQQHANWMASYGTFAHSRLPYRENIAYNQSSPEHAVQSWTYSPGHYANLCSGRECGFGYQTRGGAGYWVAVFR
jgi:uncharacterized protein YkwD